jgi:hypothetical protein
MKKRRVKLLIEAVRLTMNNDRKGSADVNIFEDALSYRTPT